MGIAEGVRRRPALKIGEVSLYEVELIRGQSSADEMLRMVCQVLQATTDCQAGTPPMGTCSDAAPCNSMVIKAFVGQLPEKVMENFDFLRHCCKTKTGLKYWPYALIWYGKPEDKWLMTSFLGGLHIQKRFGLQFMSGRKKIVMRGVHRTCRNALQWAPAQCIHRSVADV